ncbi:hypothetical protein PJL15_02850 [Paenarthrobacter nitroguajacolicus]|nr:hypothetical protein [Paenarthrobacter nitroguajacolicus]
MKLPAGTFLIDGKLRMASNVKLEGAGPTTILKAGPTFLNNNGPAGGYPIVTTAGADNTTLTNFTADQSGDTLNGNVAGRLNEYVIDVRDSYNSLVQGIHTRNPFTYSIAFVGGSKWCVKDTSTQSATNGKYTELDGIHAMNTSYAILWGTSLTNARVPMVMTVSPSTRTAMRMFTASELRIIRCAEACTEPV